MTVYVDDAAIGTVGKLTHKWSHLTADTSTELDWFALSIGLRLSWIQDAGTPSEHFDITPAKRDTALKKGAIPITAREGEYQNQAKTRGKQFGLEEVRAFRATLAPLEPT